MPSNDDSGLPTVIVPYPGASDDAEGQDIFVYLRPETNGVLAESTMLKVVKAANNRHQEMKLIFLANIPGEFIVSNHIVEQYYALKLHFAVTGKSAMTPVMKRRFFDWFGVSADEADVVGSFKALELLGKEPEELFDTWVPQSDVCVISGQCFKKITSRYVINYDIPALLHKNSKNTDIAVMIFRTKLPYEEVRLIIRDMHQAICGAGVLDPQFDAARAFHFSKGPFEQLLDGISYLLPDTRMRLSMRDFTFGRWMIERGADPAKICNVLLNPIVRLELPDGSRTEEHLLQYTQFHSYEAAYRVFNSIVETSDMIHHGPLLRSLCDSEGNDLT